MGPPVSTQSGSCLRCSNPTPKLGSRVGANETWVPERPATLAQPCPALLWRATLVGGLVATAARCSEGQ